MAKKKKNVNGNGDSSVGSESSAQATPQSLQKEKLPTTSRSKKTVAGGSSGEGVPLIICRNKHWRYISSFHGPWLHLPLEALESLAHSNYNSPRPRPIDPGVFFDLVKIRRLVGEATPLTVNAANGFGPGSKVRLSHERKHRMRDQATRRLSQAYRIDEIATSVAIMQGTTSLENVAELVLDKKPDDVDASYVHFFHEKIPSRHVVESTPFEPLNNIVGARPMEPEYLRTRAILRVFGEDFDGAVADLTSAIQLLRYHRPTHNSRDEVVPAPTPGRRIPEVKLGEDEQPTSLEMQLMFQRGAAYLSRACQCVYAALPPSDKQDSEARISEWRADARGPHAAATNGDPTAPSPSTEEEAEAQQIAARKLLKTIAKRALRDYMAFLDHIEYSPDFPLEDSEDYSRRNAGSSSSSRPSHPNGRSSATSQPQHRTYRLSQLFEPTPPSDLPPYPPSQPFQKNSNETTQKSSTSSPKQTTTITTTENVANTITLPSLSRTEYITYHPLLSDALHALLLCHSLLQTSTKELLRHAHMVGRLARLADGYPIFQASRSPARADWIEVLRRVNGPEWLGLHTSWESLCRPAPLSSNPVNSPAAVPRPQLDATSSTLATLTAPSNSVATVAASAAAAAAADAYDEDSREYPIWTERAAAVVRWVKEAPGLPPLPAAGGAKKKKKVSGRARIAAPPGSSASQPPAAEGSLSVVETKQLELRPGPPP
ncbi:hypothetical protein MCOR27_006819 [Pyricularia oryzae]|uniref:Uncharacterized protein n=1 Tax=Pyricularia oryzae TaxID=318829 RepID=A0A4P7N045_PYROR|nr:hypothetical protein MCOR01_005706 [Pyricularia oryzae]KAH9434919.1 hypothetical protein MCOR02_003885 [Pyricularia oryzae]KAI6260975.1 hypothetical protein MCOR19_002738 [Pyricularia oryzae]KAI6266749.1 hypothetical protein MCOR26_010024 [Pyricularia oryzae]KAI6275763.1 hypothetical protein MCOR27_006819 [Pyricularia oryzae]